MNIDHLLNESNEKLEGHHPDMKIAMMLMDGMMVMEIHVHSVDNIINEEISGFVVITVKPGSVGNVSR